MIMLDCKSCKENRQNVEPVPYIVHESAMARMERTIKRMWIVLILVICLLVATNGAWLWWESQWEDIYVEQEVETETGDAFVAGVGDVNYGESETDGQNP